MADPFDEIAQRVRERQAMTATAQPPPQSRPGDPFASIFAQVQASQPAAPPDATPAPKTWGERIGGVAQQAAAGVGDSTASTLGAVPDLYNRLLRAGGMSSLPEGAYRDAILHAIRLGQPVPEPADTTERVARGAGKGLANAASVLLPAGAVARTAQAGSMLQGAASALSAQPLSQLAAVAAGGGVGEGTGSPLLGTAVAIGAPLAVAGAARMVAPTNAPAMTAEAQRLLGAARREGIPLTPAQETGSKFLQKVEGAFADIPATAGREQQVRRTAQDAYNRSAMSRTGTPATNATPDTLNATQSRIGGEFQRLSATNTLRGDPQFANDMQNSMLGAIRHEPQEARAKVLGWTRDILGKMNGGQMPGTTYARFDSDLGKAIREESNGSVREALGNVRAALRGAMDRSISPADADAWNTARHEYANYKTIARAMSAPSAGTSAGDISPAALGQALRASLGKGDGYALGRGDLNDVARIGHLIKPQIPDSGTAGRTAMIRALQGQPAAGAGIGAIGGTMAGGPAGGLVGMVGGAAAGEALRTGLPKLLQAFYHSDAGRAYLSAPGQARGALLNATPDVNRELIAALLAQRLRSEGTGAASPVQ